MNFFELAGLLETTDLRSQLQMEKLTKSAEGSYLTFFISFSLLLSLLLSLSCVGGHFKPKMSFPPLYSLSRFSFSLMVQKINRIVPLQLLMRC